MNGIVTCINRYRGVSYVVAEDGSTLKEIETGSATGIKLGEKVCVEEGRVVSDRAGEELNKEKVFGKVDANVDEMLHAEAYKTGIAEIDKATERMWQKLTEAARLFLRKAAVGAPVIIRFHNDADGSSGAVGLFESLNSLAAGSHASSNFRWIMQRGVAYGKEDAFYDILAFGNYSCVEKPLLLIIDFGTSEGSNQGIAKIEGKTDIIWLDHHPIEENFAGRELEHYINPWIFGSDSGYTAGLLACVFAHAFSDADTSEMEGASLVGDYSRFAAEKQKGGEAAIILDLITSDPRIVTGGGKDLTPSEIVSALSDKKKRDELYSYARMRLDETLDAGLRSIRRMKTPVADIFLLDYSELRSASTKYPLPGRFSSKLLSRVEEGRPAVVMVYMGKYVSIRVSGAVGERADVPGSIADAKKAFPGLIESGGGHRNAASIKVSEAERIGEVVRFLAETIKEKLSAMETRT